MPVNFNEDTEVKVYEVAATGMYTCRLVDVNKVESDDSYNPGQKRKQFCWDFETIKEEDKTSTGFPFQFRVYTPAFWGEKLEKFVNDLAGRKVAEEDFRRMNVDKLKVIPWSVMTKVSERKTNGKQFNEVLSVVPAKGEPKIDPSKYAQAPQRAAGGQQTASSERPTVPPKYSRNPPKGDPTFGQGDDIGASTDDMEDPFE